MPIFNLIVKDNSGEKLYFEANIGFAGTPVVSNTGLTSVELDVPEYTVANEAVFTVDSDNEVVGVLTLPTTIQGYSKTANSETLDYKIGDSLELTTGDNIIYAVRGGGVPQ